VAQEMQKPRWEKLGFPVYDDVVKTINEPSLMDMKTGESGLGIFKGNPSKSTFPELGTKVMTQPYPENTLAV
jgi:hypothetical protein